MSKILICRGLQGSGKSTWASNWVQEDPVNRIRVNWDELRLMMGGGVKGYWIPDREKIPYLSNVLMTYIETAISFNKDLVIDNMNISKNTVMNLIRDIQNAQANYNTRVEIDIVNFTTDPATCIERDAKRERPIGATCIMANAKRNEDFLGGYDPISVMFEQDGPIILEPSKNWM